MAYTPIEANSVSPDGAAKTEPTPTADTANGNSLPNSGLQTQLGISNANGETDVTVTFHTVGEVAGYPLKDVVATVPAGEIVMFKGFPVEVFGSTLGFTVSDAVPIVNTYV